MSGETRNAPVGSAELADKPSSTSRLDDRYVNAVLEAKSEQLQTLDDDRRHGKLAGREDFLNSIFQHLQNVVDVLANLISRTIKHEASISLKILWPQNEGPPAVHTLLRDRDTAQTAARRGAPDFFPYAYNTAFSEIIESGGLKCSFVSDDLLALKLAGQYANVNDHWQALYNATAVCAVPSTQYAGESDLVGFICADSKLGKMSEPRVRKTLAIMAEHVYHVFSMALSGFEDIERPGALWQQPKQPSHSREIGWGYEGGRLTINDPSNRAGFEEAVILMEDVFGLSNELARGRGFGPHVGGLVSSASQNEEDEMSTHRCDDWLGVEDADYDAEYLRASRTPSTHEQYLRTMERLAPENEYARHVVESRNRRKLAPQ